MRALEWVRDDGADTGVLLTPAGRALESGVTLTEACELYLGEVIVYVVA